MPMRRHGGWFPLPPAAPTSAWHPGQGAVGQLHFHHGPAQAAARAYYATTQLPLFAWSSLAGGFFSERFRPDNLGTFTAYLDKLCVESYCYPENFARLERAATLARVMGVTTPQVALAYVLSQPWEVFTLVGCANRAEFAANAAALDLQLSPAAVTWLAEGGEAPF